LQLYLLKILEEFQTLQMFLLQENILDLLSLKDYKFN